MDRDPKIAVDVLTADQSPALELVVVHGGSAVVSYEFSSFDELNSVVTQLAELAQRAGGSISERWILQRSFSYE